MVMRWTRAQISFALNWMKRYRRSWTASRRLASAIGQRDAPVCPSDPAETPGVRPPPRPVRRLVRIHLHIFTPERNRQKSPGEEKDVCFVDICMNHWKFACQDEASNGPSNGLRVQGSGALLGRFKVENVADVFSFDWWASVTLNDIFRPLIRKTERFFLIGRSIFLEFDFSSGWSGGKMWSPGKIHFLENFWLSATWLWNALIVTVCVGYF